MQVKFMTKAQVERIVSNNYCGEHGRNGKQFDYEAAGYKAELDARLWDFSTKEVELMLKQARVEVPEIAKESVSFDPSFMDAEIEKAEIQISINKAFFPWKHIVNSINERMI